MGMASSASNVKGEKNDFLDISEVVIEADDEEEENLARRDTLLSLQRYWLCEICGISQNR